MKPAEIYILIASNKCIKVQLQDFNGHMLHEVDGTNGQACAAALEQDLMAFSGYKKIRVLAKDNLNTPWTKSFCWQMEYPDNVIAAPGASPSVGAPGGIGWRDFMDMQDRHMSRVIELQDKINTAQREAFEAKLSANNQDPKQWIPLIQTVGPMLGMRPGISGPLNVETKSELIQGKALDEMSGEELGAAVNERLASLNKKVSGKQMVNILAQIDSVPDAKVNADKITTLLKAIAKNPALLDQALNFIPS